MTSFFPDRTSPVALHRQLATHLRDAILTGELAGGTRLHASRALAQQLGVSRNTVTQALDQLVAEGYLEKIGAGTYVASGLTLHARRTSAHAPPAPRLSERARRLVRAADDPDGGGEPALFRPGVPDPALFPDAVWRRVANRWLDGEGTRGYGDPCGYGPLREAIAAHLRQTRGVALGAGNVIVVEGTRAALGLIAEVLLDPGAGSRSKIPVTRRCARSRARPVRCWSRWRSTTTVSTSRAHPRRHGSRTSRPRTSIRPAS
jgi:GntR family transcriptional regulator/MocR family aminotransferase